MKNLILASSSPRRKMLMEWAELQFVVRSSDIDETYPSGLNPPEVATFIARNKNQAVFDKLSSQELDQSIVISADTIVVLHDKIIGKPIDHHDAISILKRLSSQQHDVITAVHIRSNETEISFTETTTVSFHELSNEQILHYVDKYKPYDKAGAYAIQEWIGVVGIEKIQGDFYNVMGLPISRVLRTLNEYFR